MRHWVDRIRCWLALWTLLACGATSGLIAQEQTNRPSASVQFTTLDCFLRVPTGRLGAYQILLRFDPKVLRIVGVEGGAVDGFREPPFYDPKGLRSGRLQLAAYVERPELAMAGTRRVARLHVRLKGSREAAGLQAQLIVAADATGKKRTAAVMIRAAKKEDRP